MRKWKFDHITVIRDDLHWLPIWQLVSDKQYTMVYKWFIVLQP